MTLNEIIIEALHGRQYGLPMVRWIGTTDSDLWLYLSQRSF